MYILTYWLCFHFNTLPSSIVTSVVTTVGSDVQYILSIWTQTRDDSMEGGDLEVARVRQHTVQIFVLHYNLVSMWRRSSVVVVLELYSDGG